MLKKYILQIINYSAVDVIQKLTALVVVPIYASKLGNTDYGVFGIFSFWTMLISNLLILGLTNGVSQFIYDNPLHKRGSLIWPPFFIIFITGIVFLIIFNYIGKHFSGIIEIKNLDPLLYYLLLASILMTALNTYMKSCNIYLENIKTVNISFLINIILSNFIGLYLMLYVEAKVIYYAFSIFLGGFLSLVYLSYTTFKTNKPSYDKDILKNIICFSAPLFLAGMVMMAFESLDKIYIQEFYSTSDYGSFTIALQLSSIVGILVSSFLTVWPSMFHRNKTTFNTEIFYKNLMLIFTFIALLIIVLINPISNYVLQLLFTKEYWESHIYILPMSISIILQGCYTIFLMQILVYRKLQYKLFGEIFILILAFYIIDKIAKEGDIIDILNFKVFLYILLCTYTIITLKVLKLVTKKLFIIFSLGLFFLIIPFYKLSQI